MAAGLYAGEDDSAELTHFPQVGEDLSYYCVKKQAVPAGTADVVADVISRKLRSREADTRFAAAPNPQFLEYTGLPAEIF